MTNKVRHLSPGGVAVCVFAALCCWLLVLAAPAGASDYGQLARFKGKGGGSGTEFVLAGEETHAFGVDAETGRVYVGSENKEEEEELRLQAYGASGAFEGDAVIKAPTPPAGTLYFDSFEGVAVAPKGGPIYVLASFRRQPEASVDGDKIAAGALYAFNGEPSAGKLKPAASANSKGLLTEALNAGSETQGDALLEPSGITVDPLTGEILILGLVDQGAGGFHVAVDHVSGTGELLSTWVDPAITTTQGAPDSPVVTEGGTLLFEAGDELFAIAASATSGQPENVFTFAEPSGFQSGPFTEELVT